MADDDRERIKRQQESDQYNARGIEAADRNWLDEAAKMFTRAIDLDPSSAHAHDNLARVCAQQGKFLSALESYITALRLEPDNPNAHYSLACFLSAYGQDMAIDEYQQAIQQDYEFADAHVNLGLCFVEAGENDKAIAEFRIACDLDPSDLGAKQDLAASLIDIGEFTEAIRHLKDVVRSETDNLEAWIDLGIAYTLQGFYEQAERAFLAAFQINPEEILVPYHLATLYADWSRPKDAITYLQCAARLDRERTRTWVETDRRFDAVRSDPQFVRIFR